MTLDEMITANTHGEYESVGGWNIEHRVLDRDRLKQAIREAIERAYRSTQTTEEVEGVTFTFSTGTADQLYANLLRELGLDDAREEQA